MGNNFSQSNVPQDLNMQALRSAITSAGDVAKGCRFAVMIRPSGGKLVNMVPRDLVYMCEAAEFPGRCFDVSQIRYWGAGQVFPNNTLYETSNLSFKLNDKITSADFSFTFCSSCSLQFHFNF